jgi:hypothetical protein
MDGNQMFLWCLIYIKIITYKTNVRNIQCFFRNSIGQQLHVSSRTEEENETSGDCRN